MVNDISKTKLLFSYISSVVFATIPFGYDLYIHIAHYILIELETNEDRYRPAVERHVNYETLSHH